MSRQETQLAVEHNAVFIPEWHRLVQREDIDGVVICTHNDSHGEIVLAALQANKHIFVEYPLASDVGEGEAALRLAEERGRVLRVSHPEAVSNTHKALKQKISELGDLLSPHLYASRPVAVPVLRSFLTYRYQEHPPISSSIISIRLWISSVEPRLLKRVLSTKD